MADHLTRVAIAAAMTPPGLLFFGAAMAALVGTVRRGARTGLFTAMTCLVLCGASLAVIVELVLLSRSHRDVIALYDGGVIVDRLNAFIALTGCGAGLLGTLAIVPVLPRMRAHAGAAHALLLTAVLGTELVGAAGEMTVLVVGIELLTISLIILTALAKTDARAVMGSLRMVIANGVGVGLLLYGFVILYGLSGRTDFAGVAGHVGHNAASALAVTLVVAGLTTLLGAMPLWQWFGDSFGSALGPVAGLSAALTVVASTAAFVRITAIALPVDGAAWSELTTFFAVVALTYGAFRALRTPDLRHLVVALGIGQGGAVLVALGAQSSVPGQSTAPAGISDALLGMLSLAGGLLLAGMVIGILEQHGTGTDLRGLADRGSASALAATIAVATLAGLPPTFGFVARMDALAGAAVGGFAWLSVFTAFTTVLSMLAGARAIASIYAAHARIDHVSMEPLAEAPWTARVAVTVTGALVVIALPALLFPLSQLAAGAAGPLTR